MLETTTTKFIYRFSRYSLPVKSRVVLGTKLLVRQYLLPMKIVVLVTGDLSSPSKLYDPFSECKPLEFLPIGTYYQLAVCTSDF